MVVRGAAEHKVASVEDLFDVARAIADDSADPGATYESFLRGLEMGLAYNTLDPVLSKAIGNKLADMRPATRPAPVNEPVVERVPVDPKRRRRRHAARPLPSSRTDFPTEWTLEP